MMGKKCNGNGKNEKIARPRPRPNNIMKMFQEELSMGFYNFMLFSNYVFEFILFVSHLCKESVIALENDGSSTAMARFDSNRTIPLAVRREESTNVKLNPPSVSPRSTPKVPAYTNFGYIYLEIN